LLQRKQRIQNACFLSHFDFVCFESWRLAGLRLPALHADFYPAHDVIMRMDASVATDFANPREDGGWDLGEADVFSRGTLNKGTNF